MEAVIQLIKDIGFPIVMCLLMYHNNVVTLTSIKDMIREQDEKNRESLRENTSALRSLVEAVKKLNIE